MSIDALEHCGGNLLPDYRLALLIFLVALCVSLRKVEDDIPFITLTPRTRELVRIDQVLALNTNASTIAIS
jgi:hypothetical protein